METCQRNISLYLNLKQNIWLCRIKLTADTFSTQFCVTKCNGGTMKSLEIKIASFCELFQNRFYFKDLWHELSSWSVRKFWKFLFHCIINMKNNYHQTFIVVYSMKKFDELQKTSKHLFSFKYYQVLILLKWICYFKCRSQNFNYYLYE